MNNPKFLSTILIIIAIATLAGCKEAPADPVVIEAEEIDTTYYVQSCHYRNKNLTCGTEPTGPCTLDIQPTDFCGQFVSCTNNGQIAKEDNFDSCVDCFIDGNPSEECLEQFPEYKTY